MTEEKRIEEVERKIAEEKQETVHTPAPDSIPAPLSSASSASSASPVPSPPLPSSSSVPRWPSLHHLHFGVPPQFRRTPVRPSSSPSFDPCAEEFDEFELSHAANIPRELLKKYMVLK